MKAIYTTLIALLCFGFVSCEKKDDAPKLLDPNAKVYINGTNAPQPAPALVELRSRTAASESESDEQVLLTPRQVVEQTNAIYPIGMFVDDNLRDPVNERFIGGSTWVIDQEGKLETGLIEARNYIFIIRDNQGIVTDTVAYTPNATMVAFDNAVRAAYAAENYTECYRLLQEEWTFTPITGAEYKALKEANEL